MQDKFKISVFKNTLDKQPQSVALTTILEKIRNSLTLKRLSDQYRSLKTKKDKQLFKQNKLPAITVSGTFSNGHSERELIQHSGLIQIDIDSLSTSGSRPMQEQIKLLQADPLTFILFLSVSGSGLKILIRIDSSKHFEAFEALKTYYKVNYGLTIDLKCKDKGRLCFLSYDPDIWINEAAREFSCEYSTVEPLKSPKLAPTSRDLIADIEIVTKKIETARTDITKGYDNWLKLGFALADGLGDEGRQYFHRLSCLSPQYQVKHADHQFNSCLKGNKTGITIKSFFQLAKDNGILLPLIQGRENLPLTKTPIIKKTGGGEFQRNRSVNNNNRNLPLITRVEDYLNLHFEFRRNIVNEKLESRKRNEQGAIWSEANENDISRFLQKNFFNYSPNRTAALLNSDFVKEYNPISDYFSSLPKWNKETEPSYIDKLAGLIKAKDQERFKKQFTKMLIRCIACATVRGNTNPNFNKHVFVFVSAQQSSGKSTLCRWLCPPHLQEYFLENIGFDKDGNIALAQGFLINLDELASLSKLDNNHLKTFISKASINERLPYGRARKFYPRRANFIGSTNNFEFLFDETGNVRWICFEIESINFGYNNPSSEHYVDINRLWAEAYTRFLTGEEYQLSTQERLENELSNKSFQVISDEEQLVILNFEATEKNKEYFLTNADILHKLSLKGYNTSRLSSKKLGTVLRKLNFATGEERIGKFPVKGYYLKELVK